MKFFLEARHGHSALNKPLTSLEGLERLVRKTKVWKEWNKHSAELHAVARLRMTSWIGDPAPIICVLFIVYINEISSNRLSTPYIAVPKPVSLDFSKI